MWRGRLPGGLCMEGKAPRGSLCGGEGSPGVSVCRGRLPRGLYVQGEAWRGVQKKHGTILLTAQQFTNVRMNEHLSSPTILNISLGPIT